MSENNNPMGRRSYDKLSIIWAMGCGGFGIIFTVLFSQFVTSYTEQGKTNNQILNRLTGIEAQMIMSDFPNLRTDLEKLEAEVKAVKARHNEEVQLLNGKLDLFQLQIENLRNGKN